MKTIHQILDKKRQKCMKSNQADNNSEWILCSFPSLYEHLVKDNRQFNEEVD
jgi:hypothetical protein